MEGIQYIGGRLQPQNQIIDQKLNNVLIERLLPIIGSERLNEHKLQTILRTILGIFNQIPKKLFHVWLEYVSKVDGVINLCKNQHEIL